jgi:choline dehydrogenase-like flavoprotein
MIADLDKSGLTELTGYDIAIVGSGPAGATLARELAGSGLRLCVLESGLENPTAHGDRLRHVNSEGIHVKAHSRERVVGGASTTWSGLSSPLDPVDLEQRPYLRPCAWPIGAEELSSLYDEAAGRYRFPAPELFKPDGDFAALRARGEIQPTWEGIEEKIFLAAAQAQDYGSEWLDTYAGKDVDLYTDATLLTLVEKNGRVEAGRLRTRGGREVTVHARIFVLATGGIENARLLLNSQLGNEHDLVGRYLMNHPKNYHGILELERPVKDAPYFFGCLVRGCAGYAGLRLTLEEQRKHKLLNSYVRFEPLFPWSDNDGVECFVQLVKRSQSLLMFWQRQQGDKVVSLRDYSETGDDSDAVLARRGLLGALGLATRVALHLPSVCAYIFYRVSGARPTIRRVRVRNFMEMEPDPENRVVLGEDTDPYGQPVPLVLHRCGDLDRRSLLALHKVLERELPRAGLGRFITTLAEEEPWPINQDASHHMGTTRMGTDPTLSVVDPDGRVHSIDNLYCAGASVFPTSGCANPTFTIVALSIRLARHLHERLGGDAGSTSEAPA